MHNEGGDVVIVCQMHVTNVLTVMSKSLSGQMVLHPILDGFFEHLLPAITSKNAMV